MSKVLVLEPYYGGSHKVFLSDLQKHLPLTFDLHTLPARKWKWRMRLSALYFAEKLHGMSKDDHADYCCILCSTFVDVATLLALAPRWVGNIPLLTYFHENQFVYPVQVDDERDFHFALTNFTTALASDRLAFNSQYNLDSFLAGCAELLKIPPDMKLTGYEQDIRNKSTVLHPGFDFSRIDMEPEAASDDPAPAIVWNHRWEHDKNPELFFETLFELDSRNEPFNVIVLGESFQRRPAIFEEARKRLDGRLLHFGYVESRQEYYRWLKQGDIVVSTASHEFFGISVIEAVRAGCRPVLPKRLSYPELFPREFLYENDNLKDALIAALKQARLAENKSTKLTERFSWNVLVDQYMRWLVL